MSKRLAGGKEKDHKQMTNWGKVFLHSSESSYFSTCTGCSRPFTWTAQNQRCANSLCKSSIPLDAPEV